MALDTAFRAIDEVMSSRPHEEPLNILFMGGEPFLAFDFIKSVTEYIRDCYSSKRVQYKAVSNGTLVHGDIQKWLIQNRDSFEVTLSLDGDRDTHNRNRCNSYDQIDFDFFTKRYGRSVTVSSVVVPETLDKLAENVMEMERMGFGVKYALADGVEWDEKRDVQRLKDQMDILIENYLNNPHLPPMSLLSYAIWCIPGRIKPRRCSPGVWSHCVAPDGKNYSCHRSTPYYNNGEYTIPDSKLELRNVGYLKAECSQCCVNSICNACPATVASLQGFPSQVSSSCALNKVIYIANAKLAVRLFLECPSHVHIKSHSPSIQADMLAGALDILNHLQ